MPFVNDRTKRGDHKTIDRERNIVMRKIPGSPDPEVPYTLEWHGQIIKFRCETINLDQHKTENNWKFDLLKKVSCLDIPEGFLETKRAVLDVIEDALIVYGSDQSAERTGQVDVEFSNAALKGA